MITLPGSQPASENTNIIAIPNVVIVFIIVVFDVIKENANYMPWRHSEWLYTSD
jgi:hypothetical protein